MKTSRSAWFALAGLLGAACQSSSKLPPNQIIQTQVSLEAFNSCQDLQQYVQNTAVIEMRSRLEQMKHNGWGPMEDAATSGAASPQVTSAGPSAYTHTNTQVSGVDEADFMKNDGTRIFVITGDTLYLNQSWPAAALATTGQVQIEGYPSEMFLDENNHVIVLSAIYTPMPWETPGAGPSGVMCSPYWCGYYYANTTKITVVDVSDMSHPTVASQYYEPGWYSDSRRVNDSVRMVTNNELRWPQDVQWYVPYDASTYGNPAKLAAAYEALESKNESIIRSTPVNQWLQASWYKTAAGDVVELPYDCTEFRKSNTPEQLGVVSVVTLDLSSAVLAAQAHPNVARISLLSEPGQIYASTNSLYVAEQHWWWWPEPGQFDYTYFHKFDTSDPLVTQYLGSGGVAGYVLDQFSMDELNGYFRVATTIGTRVPSNTSDWGEIQWTNRISVLGVVNNQLQVVGATPDISAGESITSARFMGNKGFVSTYQYIDPLLTFDLTDPTKPTPVGQIQIPGSSTYLQGMDDTHLLAIGEYLPPEANGSVDWSQRTLQLSIFDVSDLAHPQQTFVQNVGTGWGWSEAEWDHKAFNYFAEKKLLAIPYFDYQPNNSGNYWDTFVSELRVYGVDPASGFTFRGAMTMNDVYQQINYGDWTYFWSPVIRRSVMADDYVYAVADSGIRVADVNALTSPLATVLFQPYLAGAQ